MKIFDDPATVYIYQLEKDLAAGDLQIEHRGKN